jgi:hypothetical protein
VAARSASIKRRAVAASSSGQPFRTAFSFPSAWNERLPREPLEAIVFPAAREGGRPAPAAPGPDVDPVGREGQLQNIRCFFEQAFLFRKPCRKLPQVNPRAGNSHDEAAIDKDLQEHLPDHVPRGVGESLAVEAAQAQLLDPFRSGLFLHRYRLSLSVR